ncbi:MAG: DeoR family transcriptional regulator, partial [Pseudolabrys sp.]|nr:DeoR family transcriptional regulator [Pseudolabrys sp.]
MVGLIQETWSQSPDTIGSSIENAHRSLTLTSERLRAILRFMAENGPVSVAEIATRFVVSYATARREVIMLTTTGRATRSHGRLLPARSFRGEQHFCARSAVQSDAKSVIARKAAQIL